MLNYIWAGIILVSIICAIYTGNITNLSSATLTGAENAITLIISISGTICFFSGIMKIVEESGATISLAKFFSPILSRFFPNLKKDSKAFKYICMNIIANLLGLGNAATPFGIKAMQHLNKINKDKNTASDDMITFIIMNTASLQIIPTMVTAMRNKYGSANALETLPCTWISSIGALSLGITISKLFIASKKIKENHRVPSHYIHPTNRVRGNNNLRTYKKNKSI